MVYNVEVLNFLVEITEVLEKHKAVIENLELTALHAWMAPHQTADPSCSSRKDWRERELWIQELHAFSPQFAYKIKTFEATYSSGLLQPQNISITIFNRYIWGTSVNN